MKLKLPRINLGELLGNHLWLRWVLASLAALVGAILVDGTLEATLNLSGAALGAFVSLAGFTLAGAAILVGLREHGQFARLIENEPSRWVEVTDQLFRASRYALIAAVYILLVSAFYEPQSEVTLRTPLNVGEESVSETQGFSLVISRAVSLLSSLIDNLVAAAAAFIVMLAIIQTAIAIAVLEATSRLSGTPVIESKSPSKPKTYTLPENMPPIFDEPPTSPEGD